LVNQGHGFADLKQRIGCRHPVTTVSPLLREGFAQDRKGDVHKEDAGVEESEA